MSWRYSAVTTAIFFTLVFRSVHRYFAIIMPTMSEKTLILKLLLLLCVFWCFLWFSFVMSLSSPRYCSRFIPCSRDYMFCFTRANVYEYVQYTLRSIATYHFESQSIFPLQSILQNVKNEKKNRRTKIPFYTICTIRCFNAGCNVKFKSCIAL